ncbi:hypothetical protein FD755_016076 [Muntiacus reevesi]|uniref:Uncharacterized protein n=1 Tax=Muntiacus reevesi TaxID=9886 RepID=A0A5N3XGA3_MUNRE|nr:hypothetical protein FD755_016076 [Muntiacus reevesi]
MKTDLFQSCGHCSSHPSADLETNLYVRTEWSKRIYTTNRVSPFFIHWIECLDISSLTHLPFQPFFVFIEECPTCSTLLPPGNHLFVLYVPTSVGEENGNPLQHSCLENPMDRGACWATVHGVARVGHDLVTKPPPPLLFHR